MGAAFVYLTTHWPTIWNLKQLNMKRKFEPIEWEQFTQVRSRALLHYAIPHPRPERKYKEFTAPTYSGQMTDHAARRIKKTIDIFFQISPKRVIYNRVNHRFQNFQINFVTLTISDQNIIPTKEASNNLLFPFLRKLRKDEKCSYVWKGEFQKRGQPHWHLTTNTFLHMTWVRNVWNQLQQKAGYLETYAAKTGHYNPPSTEVKSVRNLERVDMYLAKYLSKNPGNGKWDGKVWGCSENLRCAKRFSFSTNFEDDQLICDAIESGEAEQKRFDQFTLTETADPHNCLSAERQKEWASWKSNVS